MPRWSPDGNSIFFSSNRSGNWDIYRVNTDGSNLVQLTFDTSDEWWPVSFAPDASKIAFVSNRFGAWDIFLMDPDGSNVTRLTTDSHDDFWPAWSPCLPTDPLWGMQWNMRTIDLVGALNQFPNCQVPPVNIGVIDTGIDINNKAFHDELNDGRIIPRESAIGNTVVDKNGHGTHVTGIIGAIQNNGIGIAGIHPSPMISIYKYSDKWQTWYQILLERLARKLKSDHHQIAEYIIDAVDSGARVINLSIGIPYDVGPNPIIGKLHFEPCFPENFDNFSCGGVLEEAIKYALEYEPPVIIVASAGETEFPVTGHDGYSYPAAYSRTYTNVIAVASSTPDDTLGKYVITGDYINIAAPGGADIGCLSDREDCIWSLGLNNGYSEMEGTSMAAPHVTGVVALMLSVNDKLQPEEIRNILICSANEFSVKPTTLPETVGILNAREAVRRAFEGNTQCP